MSRGKSRSFDNPILVRIIKKDDQKELHLEVSSYKVTDKHLILTREGEKSRVTKYVTIDSLRSFEFDEPLGYRMPMAASIPQSPAIEVPEAISGPERPVMTIRGQKVDMISKKAIKRVDASTPLPAQPKGEKGVVEEAFATGGVATAFAP